VDTKKSFKQSFRDYLARERPQAVTGKVWMDLMLALAPVSESYLRELVRNSGLPFEQPYAGVRQHDFAELESSLFELLRVYEAAEAAGDRQRARYCRKQVIAAKDRAKFAAENPKMGAERQAMKREMAEWMLVWLENPPVFPEWVELRKRRGPPLASADP
jgi:hypothetical protein